MVQGELFTEAGNDPRAQGTPSFFSQYQFSVGLDKILLLTIGCVVLFVLTYSFGYERGHRAAEQKIQALTTHIETIAQPAVPITTAIETKTNDQIERTVAPTDSAQPAGESDSQVDNEPNPSHGDQSTTPAGKYTIQIATTPSKDRAAREVVKLGTIGHKSFFIQRGKHYEICIGSFDTVASAKSLLNEFKSKGPYFDAFVRPNS